MLVIGMIGIIKIDIKWITKNRFSLIKRNTMFNQIRCRFICIPFKNHAGNLIPLPLPGEGLFLTSRRPPFNQQPPFDLEDLTAKLLLAQLLLVVLLDKQIRAVGFSASAALMFFTPINWKVTMPAESVLGRVSVATTRDSAATVSPDTAGWV